MQTWMRFGAGVAAIALAIAAGTAAYAMRGTDQEPSRQAGADTPVAPEDSADQDVAGGTFAAICAAGQPDCDDTVDVPIGDFGESKCAADVVNCVDPNSCIAILPADPGLVDPGFEEPALIDPSPPQTRIEPQGEPGVSEPGAPPNISDEELKKLEGERARASEACVEPVPCIPGPADGCLPPDCAVSSDGAISCPDPYTCVQMGIPEPAPDDTQPLPLEDPCAYPCVAVPPDSNPPGTTPEQTLIARCGQTCASPPVPDPAMPQDDPAATFPCVLEPCIELLPLDPSAGGAARGETQPCPPAPEPCAVGMPETVCILPAPATGGGSGSSAGVDPPVPEPAPAE